MRVQLQGLAILARPVLQLAAPVGQVTASDVASDAPLHGHAPWDALLLRGRGVRKRQQRRDVIRKVRELGEVLLDRIAPRETVELHVRMVIGVEARTPDRVPAHGVRPHGEAFQELPRRAHVDFGKVTLNGRGAKVSIEPRDVDLQRLERAEEQRVALETVQPHGGVWVDVLKCARDHLQACVVDLVIGQPLDEDPPRLQDASAQLVELPRVQVAVARVLGVEGIDRQHVVGLGCDQEVVAPIVDDDPHAWVGEDVVIHLGKEARRADHARNELHDVEPPQCRVATQRPSRPARAEADHQNPPRCRVQQHRQMSEHFLDFGIVVHQRHVRIRAAGPRNRPTVDAQQLAVVDVGGDLHHAGDVLVVVKNRLLRLARDIGEAERRRRDHHRDEAAQGTRIEHPLATP